MSIHNIVTVQEIDVTIPVQAFRFEFMVVGRSDLSFIREFVLRLLKVGDMTPDQVAKFLGLSEKEILVAITQLSSMKEVTINHDGRLRLSAESLKYFDNENDRPKVHSIFERTHTFKFDLFNFDYITSSQSTDHPLRAIRLKPAPVILSESTSYAKQAFLRSYLDLFEKESINFDGINSLHDVELYKLTDIRKTKDHHVRVTLKFNLDIERNTIERSCKNKLYENAAITNKMNDYLFVTTEANNIQNIAKAMEFFEDTISLECLTPDGFDGTGYVIKLRSESSVKSKTEHILGALTLRDNWEKIFKPIQSLFNKVTHEKNKDPRVIWVAPSDRYWIQSETMFNRMKSLRDFVKHNNFSLMVPVDGADDRYGINSWRSQLGDLKEQSEKIHSGFLGGAVELILIPEYLAVVVYHLQRPNEPMSIPLGFITKDLALVKKINESYESYLASYSESLETRYLGHL